ncbi:MAG TPA: protein kinase [Pyrinomonadaceae bacterium]|nr:protein kinase [Pyrinomonadaceae bacterium]
MTITAGTRLSRYEIRSQLGAGGMGEVYLALDTELDRKVAIKILPADVAANQDRMRRFAQEARAAAALNHPNIAHIYEIGRADGVNFIAMEFVDGETFRDKMHGENSDLKILLKHLLQVAEGLAKAHAGGIVHRDLKPDNIMITRDGHAKILDFGLAKLIEPTGRKPDHEGGLGSSEIATVMMPVQHSTPGVVMGTVGYMSPEQAQAKSVDQRSDIFSFGCILYEAATGRKPFVGDSIIDTLHKIIHEPAPSITDLNPSASLDLQRVIRKCLAKEPEKRYQTIRDTANDLEELIEAMKGVSDLERSVAPPANATASGPQIVGGKSTVDDVRAAESTVSTSQQPASSAQYIVSGIKQHKLAAVIGLLVLVVGAVGLGLYLHARNTEMAIESIAVLPFDNQNHDPETEYLSDGLTDSIINSLTQLPNLKVIARSSVFRYKGKQTDPIAVANELGVRAVLTGRIMQRGDSFTIGAELIDARDNKQLWGDQYERKLADLLSVQREIAKEITSNLRLKLSGAEQERATKQYTEKPEAYQLYLKGRLYWNKRTGEAIKKAIEYFSQAVEKDPGYALAYVGLADCYVVPANPRPPNEKMPKARAAARRALELDETLAEGHTALARVLAVYDWDWVGAENEFKRAIKLNPRYAGAHQWYGGYLEMMGRRDESLAERKQALELDPLSLTINFELALAFYYARDYDQAIQQFQKTLELDANFPLVHAHLPAAYEQKGMYDQAIAGFQKGVALRGGTEWSFSMSGLGHVYGVSGKKAEARAVLDELKQASQQEYVPADSIALVYAGLGEKDQAFTWLEKAYEEHAFKMAWLKVDPQWDSLRSDPRFADLLRRVGLPQ